MHCKNAYMVINPRAGQDMTKLSDIIAVLSAAGWSTDNALVEYSGHAGELATKAAKQGYDLVIAHGGDGTVNEVVNAVMNSKQSIIGVLPGGTANQWAHEIAVPVDPVKAALTLVNSDARKVDIGRVQVQELRFPNATQQNQEQQKKGKKAQKERSKAAHYFLLTAGLGIDASIISHTSKSLKERIGRVAFDVAAAKELPEQHAFPVEICAVYDEQDPKLLWHGEALQIILGNTRRYADVVELTPNAFIDDGLLDVCVITAGGSLTAIKQAASLLLRRKPDNTTTEYLQGAHLSVTVPASIALQLDGSAVEFKDYLSASDREALQHIEDAAQGKVTYRFDVMPHALEFAIPRTYDNTLFAHASGARKEPGTSQQAAEKDASQLNQKQPEQEQRDDQKHHDKQTEEVQQGSLELGNALLENGHKVTVVGVAPNPEKQHTYIIAGSTHKQSTDEIKPAAVCIDDDTVVIRRTGEHVSASTVEELQEGTVIVVEGKESKRGVIKATRAVL